MVRPALRDELLFNYRFGQGAISSGAVYDDFEAFWPHFEANYSDLISGLGPSDRVVDAGCGAGSFVGWLRHRGCVKAEGVDLSPGDVTFANRRLGSGTVTLGSAQNHLALSPGTYDAIFMKAMLEHIRKDDLLPLLDVARTALRPGGRLIIEVPNMDWLMASHERYMDLTHEVGFTRESLASLLALTFTNVSVRGSRLAAPTRSQRLFRRPLLAVTNRLLYVLGEGASDFLFAHRSIIATASA
jgi:SAM-dependent methyltransferase